LERAWLRHRLIAAFAAAISSWKRFHSLVAGRKLAGSSNRQVRQAVLRWVASDRPLRPSAGLFDCDKPDGGKLAKRLFDKAPVCVIGCRITGFRSRARALWARNYRFSHRA
jgi:hypothetical protein